MRDLVGIALAYGFTLAVFFMPTDIFLARILTQL